MVIGAWLCMMSEARPAVTSALHRAEEKRELAGVDEGADVARIGSQPAGRGKNTDERDQDGETQGDEEDRGQFLQPDLPSR